MTVCDLPRSCPWCGRKTRLGPIHIMGKTGDSSHCAHCAKVWVFCDEDALIVELSLLRKGERWPLKEDPLP